MGVGREYFSGNRPTGFPFFCHLHSAWSPMFSTRHSRVVLDPGTTRIEEGSLENFC